MRGQPVGNPPPAAVRLVQPRERAQHPSNAGRVPSRGRGVLHAQPVGLQLVVASVLQEHDAKRGLGEVLEGARLRHEDAQQGDAKPRGCGLGVALRRMSGGDVPDLMPEHAGKLRLVAQVRKDAAREIDVAPRQGEGVDCRLVDNREAPGQPGPLRCLCQPQADIRHVPLQLRIVVQPHLAADFPVVLLAELDLLRLAHERELPLAGGGVGGTGREQDEQDGRYGRSQTA